MKFVMVKSEVAHALAMTEEQFDTQRVRLELHGFPVPIAGLDDRWSIIDVMNWVNRQSGAESLDRQAHGIGATELRH